MGTLLDLCARRTQRCPRRRPSLVFEDNGPVDFDIVIDIDETLAPRGGAVAGSCAIDLLDRVVIGSVIGCEKRVSNPMNEMRLFEGLFTQI